MSAPARPSLLERLGRWNLRRQGATGLSLPEAPPDATPGPLALHAFRFARHPRAPDSAPPLVLMHGVGSSATTFSRLVKHLRPHVGPILLPEAPAHGESPIPDGPLSPDTLFAHIAAFLDAVPDAPFVLYGNSLGGGAALRYATLRPERVSALVLLSPAGADAAHDQLADLVETFHFTRKGDARRFVRRLFHTPHWYHALAARELARRFASAPLREFFARAGAEDLLSAGAISALPMPILFLWGGAEKLLPDAHREWFLRHLPPHAERLSPPHFAHSAYVEHPDQVATHLLEFLRRHGLVPLPAAQDDENRHT